MTQYKLFTDVAEFYRDLQDCLKGAQQYIDMAYYAFDDGLIAQEVAAILAERAAGGVKVRVMVDEAGLYLDNWQNSWRNRRLVAQMRASGVQVDLFRPHGSRLSQANRLHCKFCDVDGRSAYIGGSNIGDHYLSWRDTNLRLVGNVGDGFKRLYETLLGFGGGSRPSGDAVDSLVAGSPMLLTVPGRRQDIRRALLALILSAKREVTIRSWYFLPDQEILNALLSQAEKGVKVTILFSHKTRVPLLDLANRRMCRQLRQSGATVLRYRGRFMHAKEAWNEQGEILLGSANVDRWAMRTNFECCLQIKDQALSDRLVRALRADRSHCHRPEGFSGRGLPRPRLV